MRSLLVLLVAQARADLTILTSSPANGTLVKEREELVVTCTADSSWAQCWWLSPAGEKECAIMGSTATVCPGVQGATIGGTATSCSLTVKEVSTIHQGAWTCILQDKDTLNTFRRSVAVEVAQEAQVDITVEEVQQQQQQQERGPPGPLGWSNNVGSTFSREGSRVYIQEGTQVEVRCHVLDANPRPMVEWIGPEGAALELPPSQEGYGGEEPWLGDQWTQEVSLGPGKVEKMEKNAQEHTFNSISMLSYTAKAWHNNASLTCEVVQANSQGKIMFRKTSTLLLQVNPRPIQFINTGPDAPVGIIVGVLVAILVIITLIILLVVCLLRRRKREKNVNQGERSVNGGGAPVAPQQNSAPGPGVWLRLTTALRRPQTATDGSTKQKAKPQGKARPFQGRTLSPIPGSVQSNSRPGSRTSQNMNGSRNSLASGSRHGSRTSINTQQSVVNMAPQSESAMNRGAPQLMPVSMAPPVDTAPAVEGRESPSYSLDETEML